MGFGDYSHEAHVALTRSRADAPHEEVFKQRSCHPLMSPKGVRFRESRDSADHPNSIGIVFALDVTGSMGVIPRRLAEEELPKFMKTLMDCGVKDPQLLFCAVGDATCDQAPLQVGQFESTAELMDQWLTRSFLEKGGGGQGTESYELAMYFFAQHTDMDCWRKRKKRGYFFMTGDELPYPLVSRHQVDSLVGDTLDQDVPVAQVVAALEKTFEPFFLIPDLDRRVKVERQWRDLLGDHVVCMESPHDTCFVAAGIVALREGAAKGLDDVARLVKAAGAAGDRVGPIVRALEPYAATLERDGAPKPHVEGAGLPRGDGASGWKKT